MQHYFTLKEVKLNNNCPECYSNEGLQLTFKQRLTENVFYKAITEDTINEMHCTTCNSAIFPVQWTNDIERVVAYQQRAIQPRSKSLKLKKLAWMIIAFEVLLLLGIVLFVSGVLSF